jgi:hypothetical protein
VTSKELSKLVAEAVAAALAKAQVKPAKARKAPKTRKAQVKAPKVVSFPSKKARRNAETGTTRAERYAGYKAGLPACGCRPFVDVKTPAMWSKLGRVVDDRNEPLGTSASPVFCLHQLVAKTRRSRKAS